MCGCGWVISGVRDTGRLWGLVGKSELFGCIVYSSGLIGHRGVIGRSPVSESQGLGYKGSVQHWQLFSIQTLYSGELTNGPSSICRQLECFHCALRASSLLFSRWHCTWSVHTCEWRGIKQQEVRSELLCTSWLKYKRIEKRYAASCHVLSLYSTHRLHIYNIWTYISCIYKLHMETIEVVFYHSAVVFYQLKKSSCSWKQGTHKTSYRDGETAGKHGIRFPIQLCQHLSILTFNNPCYSCSGPFLST